MNKVIVILLLCGLLAACTKNGNYPSTPDLTYESVSGNVIPNNSAFEINMKVRDAEGDISDSVFYHQDNIDLNIAPFVGKVVPSFPQKRNLDAQISLIIKNNEYQLSAGNTPDTLTFSVYLKDQAGHISDTIKTPPVVFLKQ